MNGRVLRRGGREGGGRGVIPPRAALAGLRRN